MKPNGAVKRHRVAEGRSPRSTPLEEAGVTLTPEQVPDCEPTFDEASRATIKVLYGPTRPTALFTVNYELTLGALKAISEAGLGLGRDISLIGFDVGDLAGLFIPRITTIEQPTSKLARAAARQILARLRTPHAAVETLQLDAELLLGGSVARIRR
ncbi:substrate-binding domain-containing protein [Tessaracoccus sp. Y1736]